jgi:hypothetical protein
MVWWRFRRAGGGRRSQRRPRPAFDGDDGRVADLANVHVVDASVFRDAQQLPLDARSRRIPWTRLAGC